MAEMYEYDPITGSYVFVPVRDQSRYAPGTLSPAVRNITSTPAKSPATAVSKPTIPVGGGGGPQYSITAPAPYQPAQGPSIAEMFATADPYRQRAEQDITRSSQVSASAGELPTLLRNALNEKLSTGALVQERGQAASDFLSALGQAPARVLQSQTGGVILSPTEQEALISGYRGSSLLPLIMANQRYDLNTGSIADIIESAGGQANKMAQLAQSQAGISRQAYEDLISRLTTQAQFDWEKTKFNKQMEFETNKLNQQLALDYAQLARRASGTGTGATKAQQELIKTQSGFDLARNRISQVEALLSAGGSGLVAGLQAGFSQRFGGGLPANTAALNSALSNLNQTIFEVAGKALTEPERKILEGRIPKIGDNAQVIQQKLNALKNDLDTQEGIFNATTGGSPQGSVIDRLTTDLTQSRPSLSSFEE